MYLELRRNAFYLKISVWNREKKRTETNSIYLGSTLTDAKIKLEEYASPDSGLFKQLEDLQEAYAYKRAIKSLKRLVDDLPVTSQAAAAVYRLYSELKEAQKRLY